MRHPLVSVIVPAYNAAAFLPSLARSLQAQTFGDFEVLVHDDGSTDETRAAIAPFLADGRFQFSRWSPNRGVVDSTRLLLSRMRGEFWCHPGADDELKPLFMERRMKAMEEHSDAFMIHGPGEVMDETGAPMEPLPQPPTMPATLGAERALRVLLEHNIVNTPSVMLRTAVTRKVLPCFTGDWRYAQDWFLWLLHASAGVKLIWSPEVLHRYRVHRNSLTFRTDRIAVREAEVRLVPLCGLAVGATRSSHAAGCWHEYRNSLYALWLRRAAELKRTGTLEPQWMRVAAQAYYGVERDGTSVAGELCRKVWHVVYATFTESFARRRNAFPVSGLASIRDPMFER